MLLFPEAVIRKITRHCWFVSSFEDGWAFALSGMDIGKNEYLIFLSDELLHQHVGQIRYTIAHEIGHVVLGHKNAILVVQSKREIKKQEREADEFVKHYLGEPKLN